MDAAQWAKEVASHASYNNNEVVEEKKVKPQHEEALNCPRCNSTNTKFCYYNNYSLTQPRYFCKACKRYWTKGGSLRSVPVGGGSRKNKRSSSSSSSSSSLPKPIDLSRFSSENYEPAYHHLGFSQFLKLPKIENTITNNSAMSLVSAHQDLNSTHSDPMFNGTTRFSLQDFKPTLGFPFQGNGIKYGSFQGNQEEEDGERIMLPFGDLNQQHSSREGGHNMGHGNSIGYWNENLGVGDSSTLYN